MFALLACLATISDTKQTNLPDGFVRVETAAYTIELPPGWSVSRETSFGQREMSKGEAQMTAMTAPGGGRQSWDRLYQTAVYFSTRGGGKATPYKLTKTKQGYEAMSYSVLDGSGWARTRYMILKSKNGNALALSVKIPGKQREGELTAIFDRLVHTAKIN
jgi:hypothetical protein